MPPHLKTPNGLEMSRPAAQASVDTLSRILAGEARANFPDASRVSCSELLGRSSCQASARSFFWTSCPYPARIETTSSPRIKTGMSTAFSIRNSLKK